MSNLAPVMDFPTIDRVRTRSSSSSSRSSSYGNEGGTSCYSGLKDYPDTYLGIVYEMQLGRPASPGLRMRLEEWAEELHPDVVEYAIMEAALAPRPSWAYIEAILRKCRGIDYKPLQGCSLRTSVEYAREKLERR